MPTRGTAGDWMENERERFSVVRELQRLKRRAKARPFSFILLAVLLAVGVVYMKARRPTKYKAVVVLRATEGTLSRDRSPLPRRELRNYIATLAFTRANLLALIEDLDLYPRRIVRGDDWAVSQLRSNTNVAVYRNYFADDRGYATSQRSARIGVVFRDTSATVAIRVARRLASLIADSENQRRRKAASGAETESQKAVARARAAVLARQQKISQAIVDRRRATQEGDTARAAQLSAELDRLKHQLVAENDLLTRTEKARAGFQLAAAMEHQEMGLSFQVADERLPDQPSEQAWVLFTAIGVIAFLVLLPLCAIGVGAFDSRVHEPEDVLRLGLEVVGHVPGFPGDRVGAMRNRGATRNRVP